MQKAERNRNYDNANDEMVVLFSPLTGRDYKEAKSKLESAQIPYDVKIGLFGAFYWGGRFENYSTTKILVDKTDKQRAELVCKIQIDNTQLARNKQKEKSTSLIERIKSFFRIF